MFYYAVAILKRNAPLFTYAFESTLPIGQVVTLAFKHRIVEAAVINEQPKPSFECAIITARLPKEILSTQLTLAQFISTYYVCELSKALSLFTPLQQSSSIIDEAKRDEKVLEPFDEAQITLSAKQHHALEFLEQQSPALLFADTGAGKTEIYMKRMASFITQGKQALLLMPEISLTPQTFSRLQHYFGKSRVALWHSKLTPKQRQRNLEQIQFGDVKVIAGARSALFLPLVNLGIIVVDEEHDESYKSSQTPRYNARDVALYYAKMLEIPIVLGSATPSLNSYVNIPHFRLKGGFYESSKTYLFEHSSETISTSVIEQLEQSASKQWQSIFFLPTRASFKYVQCQSCGYTLECPFCSVGMSLHKTQQAMRCHYCNYTEPIPKTCARCGNHEMQSVRLGTAEASAVLQKQFPLLNIVQFDRDTITTAPKLQKVLNAFNEGSIDVLVGTQMLSKGHDYHGVRLVVIMGVDNIKEQSDYRAYEKAVSLMVQIAGRSGRKQSATVFIQTKDEPFFSRYMNDYELFLNDEKAVRVGLYPPFKRLARLIFTDKVASRAEALMQQALLLLQGVDGLEVVGAAAAPIARIANRYRYVILLRANRAKVLIQAATLVKSLRCDIDMDPLEFN